MTPNDAGGDQRDPVEELAEEFLERYRRGERPALSEFITRAPAHAEDIRELFPALIVMEQTAEVEIEKEAPNLPAERFGEYRIIREVGRGGMGIVYEAEHEALGRQVALKVLLKLAAADARAQLRFRREARSAARLHHTNVVPVFDIGTHDGVHFYAMQLIQGQGLDQVIATLNQQRGQGTEGHFPFPSGAATDPVDSLAMRRSHVDADQTEYAAPALANGADLSGRPGPPHYQAVARIGLQVASALAHAHGHGILHRDIKPSNLLIDARGTVWVTDFGLAKLEGDDLTQSGDVVGTLRYMAPERFSGVTDARSDIYSLGLTLYELLTLQPAFGEANRLQLVQAIVHHEPKAPRRFDPGVPRDLETIVLKAISKDPAGRYQSAAEFEDDLGRFLADRPIQARRTSLWERVVRWGRRNPGWAATIALVFGLLIVVAVGGTVMSFRLQRAVEDLQEADREKTETLFRSHLEGAKALRVSGRVGQRFESLRVISEAAKIKITPELRDEAAAALVLPDVKLAREWDGFPAGTVRVVHDARLERYVRMNAEGGLSVCLLTGEGERVTAVLPVHGRPPFRGMWLSPDGRFLVVGHSCPNERYSGGVRVWRLDGAPANVHADAAGIYDNAAAFSDDSRRLALGHPEGLISLYDLDRAKEPVVLRLGEAPYTLAFDPAGARLAVSCRKSIRLFDTATGKELPALSNPKVQVWRYGLAWHPAGKLLAAAAENDRSIHLWDVERGVERAPLVGHTLAGILMSFNRAGDRLISTGWDKQTRLWDPTAGRLLLTMQGNCGAQFSRDGDLIGMGISGVKLQLWRVAPGSELRLLRRPNRDNSDWLTAPVLDDEGRMLAANCEDGLCFFDLATGAELASLRLVGTDQAHPRTFDKQHGWMTAGGAGVLLWPKFADALHPDRIRVGPPKLVAPTRYSGASTSLDGRVRAIPQGKEARVLRDGADPEKPVRLGPFFDVRDTGVSPDGRWVATFAWFWDAGFKSVQVWDAQTGRHVADLPGDQSTHGAFSPDGRWLAVYSDGTGCQLWEVGTWNLGKRFDQPAFCWSRDGKLFVINDVAGAIRLVEPTTGREVCRLTGPETTWFMPGTLCLSPDGTKLLARAAESKGLYVWDLRRIREQLQALDMDWDLPRFSPSHVDRRTPLTVAVDRGFLPPLK